MEIKGIERLIILGFRRETKKHQYYPIKNSLQSLGKTTSVIAAIALVVLFLIDVFGTNDVIPHPFSTGANISPHYLIVILIIAAIVAAIVWFSIAYANQRIEALSQLTAEEMFEEEKAAIKKAIRDKRLIYVVGIITFSLSINRITLLSHLFPDADGTILFICLMVLVFIFVSRASVTLYKVCLIDKYCPYLQMLENRLYDRDNLKLNPNHQK